MLPTPLDEVTWVPAPETLMSTVPPAWAVKWWAAAALPLAVSPTLSPMIENAEARLLRPPS